MTKPKSSRTDEDVAVCLDDRIWITNDANELKLKFFTVSHAGQAVRLGGLL